MAVTVKGIVRKITDVFARGSIGWLVSDDVRECLKAFKIKGIAYHPGVYVDEKDNWHENYWYQGFYDRLDCWDRDKSEYIGDESSPLSVSIVRYSLNEKLLDSIPEESRLMFMMKGEGSNDIFCHKKIVDIFEKNKFTGVRFIKVSDFHLSMEFMDSHPRFIQF